MALRRALDVIRACGVEISTIIRKNTVSAAHRVRLFRLERWAIAHNSYSNDALPPSQVRHRFAVWSGDRCRRWLSRRRPSHRAVRRRVNVVAGLQRNRDQVPLLSHKVGRQS